VVAAHQPLSGALGACADELAALASRCEALQSELAPALQGGAAIEEAQSLDLLTQSLSAVSLYLAALSTALPQDWTVDPRPAAALVPLAELARRLTGGAFPPPAASGDLDLFGAH
jgi:hypothetical protein